MTQGAGQRAGAEEPPRERGHLPSWQASQVDSVHRQFLVAALRCFALRLEGFHLIMGAKGINGLGNIARHNCIETIEG